MLALEKTTPRKFVEVCCLYAHPTKMCLSELVYSISGLFGHDKKKLQRERLQYQYIHIYTQSLV